MTLSSDQSQQAYAGNGTAYTFSIPFRVQDKSHLTITETNIGGDVRTLVEGTDFTYSNLTAYTGWQVNLIEPVDPYSDPRPLPDGYSLLIARTPPFTQLTELRNQSSFRAVTHEDKFDYLTMLAQSLRDTINNLPTSVVGGTGTGVPFTGPLVGTKDASNQVFTMTNRGVALGASPQMAIIWCNFPLIEGVGFEYGPGADQVTFYDAPKTDDDLYCQGVM